MRAEWRSGHALSDHELKFVLMGCSVVTISDTFKETEKCVHVNININLDLTVFTKRCKEAHVQSASTHSCLCDATV